MGVQMPRKIKQRRREVKTGKSSLNLEQSVLATRHETRVDRVKLQGEGGGGGGGGGGVGVSRQREGKGAVT